MGDGYTLTHSERLKLRKQIETLFRSGEAFSVYPFRVVYTCTQERGPKDAPVRVGFSVPKKRMPHAVQRNRIKRLCREAWRLQKHALYPLVPADKQMHLFFIFIGKEIPDFKESKQAVSGIIHNLQAKLRKLDPAG